MNYGLKRQVRRMGNAGGIFGSIGIFGNSGIFRYIGICCNSLIRVALAVLLSLTFTLSAAAQESEEPVDWHELSEAQNLARSNEKKVFVFAEAEWCTYCKRMRSDIFPREDVQALLEEHYYPVSVDIESDEQLTFNGNTMTQREFSRQMRVSATPTLIILDASGEVMGVQPGFLPADVFVPLLEYVVSDSYGKMEFKEYLENRSEG